MAEFGIHHARVELQLSMSLGEKEARALHAISEYGTDAFLKVFYEHLGESALKPHEAGLRSLLLAARGQLAPLLGRADKAREAFKTT